MKQSKILMVEDDTDIFLVNREFFEGKGYEVVHAASLSEACFQVEEHAPDIVLLDVMLPDGMGWDFCAELRNRSRVPVIYLTSRDENESIVKGLLGGADDYVTKPYSLEVLHARVIAQLRRAGVFTAGKIELPPLEIDLLSGEAVLCGRQICFTQKELQLLSCFVLFAGQRLSSQEICKRAWGSSHTGLKQSLAVHVTNLRKKMNLDESSYFELKSTGKGEYIFSKIRY